MKDKRIGDTSGRLGGCLAGVLIVLGVGGCGRSENIGWASRQQPDGESDAEAAAEEAAAEATGGGSDASSRVSGQAQLPVDLLDPPALAAEYQQLFQSLSPLRERALAADEVAAAWSDLIQAVHARVVENSEFHSKLMERRAEIVARLENAKASGEVVPVAEQLELATNLKNIQTEMARVRAIELQQPEFAPQFFGFQAMVFDKMRGMEPERAAEIDRLQELGAELLTFAPPAERNPILPLRFPDEVEPRVVR